jgi:enoyl-CoA hydratase
MIHYEVRERVAIITLDRPEARNAIDPATAAEIEETIDRFEADDDVWVGIIAGRGPVFSAGADLKAVAAGRAAEVMTRRGGFAGFCRRARTKPVIAAVDGAALAGGCEIVAACDLVVASTAASFGIPEVKRSLIAAGGGLFRLGRKLPPNVAMELALTGDPLSAEQAYVHGLVNQLVEPGGALEAALALAARITANAPVAVRLSRQVLLDSVAAADDDAWRITNTAYKTVLASEDFQEGPRAFVEKRAPRWSGR